MMRVRETLWFALAALHVLASAGPSCTAAGRLRYRPPSQRAAPHERLLLRGGTGDDEGALDDWAEVMQALEETKRELKVHVNTPDMSPELQERLWRCEHLQVLVLTGSLERLPPGIAALAQLTTLIVSGTALASLPSALAELPHLRVLECEDNHLGALPAGPWPALEVLNVARNQLQTLAPLASASKLLVLKADGNLLASASAVPLDSWTRLKTLSLAHNALRQVPAGSGKLQQLEALDLRHNELQQLPAEMGLLSEKKLKILEFVDGNLDLEDKNRLSKIMTKGKRPVKEVLDYLRTKGAAVAAASDSAARALQKGTKAEKKQIQERARGRGAGGDSAAGEGTKARGLKMSKRQAELYRGGVGKAAWEPDTRSPSAGDSKSAAAAQPAAASDSADSDASDASSDDSSTSSASSASASASSGGTKVKGTTNKAGKGAHRRGQPPGAAEQLEIPIEAFTGHKFKSEAECMVERGEAKDLDHARRLIRKLRGLAAPAGGPGDGNRAAKGKGSKGGGGGGAGKDRASGGVRETPAAAETETLFVKEGCVGLLIGKGGATIKKVQEDSGARVSVLKDGGKGAVLDEVRVLVSGSGPQVGLFVCTCRAYTRP